jgi:hypothetical protein
MLLYEKLANNISGSQLGVGTHLESPAEFGGGGGGGNFKKIKF